MFLESILIALKSIWSNKLRSFLTTLGIVIGVAAVIAVVAIVQGLHSYLTQELQSVGSTYMRIMPDFHRQETGLNRIKLTYDDALALKKEVPFIKKLSPLTVKQAEIKNEGENYTKQVLGTTQNFQNVINYYAEFGRFLNGIDVRHSKQVCVIGREVVNDLFDGANPLGENININERRFTVIGVMEEKGQFLGANQDDVLIIPFSSATVLFGKQMEEQIFIDCKIDEARNIQISKEMVTQTLRKQHSLQPDEQNDFRIIMQKEMVSMVGRILSSVTAVIVGVVSISLIVGGIGIMNIMLVSVSERTKEIGIRMAVGAKRRDILFQFLIEAVVLSLIGGLIGIFIGYWVGIIAANLIPNFPAAHVPMWAILLGCGVSTLVGVVSGVFPAARASRLDPIDALRYE